MAKRIGVLTVHGMGEQKPDFDQGLRQRLTAQLPANVRKDVAFQTVFCQDLMQGNQGLVWGRMEGKGLRWKSSRRFFLYNFSDAATYEHAHSSGGQRVPEGAWNHPEGGGQAAG